MTNSPSATRQAMPSKPQRIYSSKIIKAGALLPDTKMLLVSWDESLTVSANLDRFRHENLLGKTSRSRLQDILHIFRQRYLENRVTANALARLAKAKLQPQVIDNILYFHSSQADRLLHDVVTEILAPLQSQGYIEVLIQDVQRTLDGWVNEGRTSGSWTAYTTLRVTQGVLSTLRDFGILSGAVKKRIAPAFLPIQAFAYVAFYLSRKQRSGQLLIDDPEWRLFFLSRQSVEHLFVESQQHRLLEYHAAGSVVRIDFPTESVEEYASVIIERSHGSA